MLRLSQEQLQALQKKHKVKDANLAMKTELFAREKIPTKSKYKNRKTVVDGITFHSAKEAKRYQELKLLANAGEITDLDLQEPFEIEVCGMRICRYIVDFAYKKDGLLICEDVKGFKTQAYQIKKKLMKACYGIDILET